MNEKGLVKSEKIYTVEEYLNFERRDPSRHEFHKGKILAASSSSRRHNLIGSNTIIALGSRLRGHKCEIYVNDMRVKISDFDYCYPDVIIVKGEPKFDGNETDILLNPTIIIEILSRKTLYYDKTEKLESYMKMPSVSDCLLIKEDEMRIEHYAKQNSKQWMFRIYNESEEMIALESIGCKSALSEIYAQIRFN
ncbi:MAG: Uma2 family endonuclease [Pyrinomonadaceae bacterium]